MFEPRVTRQPIDRELSPLKRKPSATPLVNEPARRDHALHGSVAIARVTDVSGGAVEHLFRRRHAGRREQHQEHDLRRTRRGERRDPGALAEAPQADPRGVDFRAAADPRDDVHRVIDLNVKRHVVTAAVEARDGDAAPRQDTREVAEEEVVARAVARGMEANDRGMRTGSDRKRDVELGQTSTPAARLRWPISRSRSCFARILLRMR